MMKLTRYFLIIFTALWFTGCSSRPEPLQKFSKTGDFFSSVVRLDVCYESGQQDAVQAAIDEIWTRFTDIHWRLSVYDPNSDMNRLNQAYPEAATIGADTYQLIKDAMGYHALSGGMFDITIYPLLKVWKLSEKQNVLPTADDIRLARVSMGMDQIETLKDNQVRLLHPETRLSIDSIADGYAADEAARILRAHGFENFLVDATGELYAGGRACDGKPWRIGVKAPDDPSAIVDVLSIENAAVTTSGSYERFYTIQGQTYSHIINPVTGFPRDDIVSATAIAPNAEFSDFLSTALCAMDPQKGIELIDSLGEGYAGMLILRDGSDEFTTKSSRDYDRYTAKE